jgi:hypothetical protein
MPRVFLCPACGKKLKVADTFNQPRAKCPSCGKTVGIPAAGPPAAPAPPPKPRPPQDQYALTSDQQESPRRIPQSRLHGSEDDDRSRPRKSVKGEVADRPRKKRRRKRPAASREGMAEWVPWAAALGAYLLVTLVAALLIAWAGPKELVIIYAIMLAVMIPVSTVILIVSMIISSALAGGISFGEVHVVILKSVLLLLIVNTIGLLPFDGTVASVLLGGGTLVVWLVGLMYFFDLDFWEARFLIFINWVLNFLVKWLLVAIIISALVHGGPRPPGLPPPPAQEDLDEP